MESEKNRNTRQVSHLLWALARRTRLISGRLRAQATQLLLDSQALEKRWRRLESRPSPGRVPRASSEPARPP